jgi:hypothetical protein
MKNYKYLITIASIAIAKQLYATDYDYDCDGVYAGYEYVNLGLPSGTLWATYNVGATSPYENGDYFAWGDIEPKNWFDWGSYKFLEGLTIDPYLGSWYNLTNIGTEIGGVDEYDAAVHAWGNGWRMPNDQESYELRMLCWGKWVTEGGVTGIKIHGPNEHTIFLPANGYGPSSEPQMIGIQGAYWLGFDEPENAPFDCNTKIEPSNYAKAIILDSGGISRGGCQKFGGKGIRAVFNPKETGIYDIQSDKLLNFNFINGEIILDNEIMFGKISVYDLSGRNIYNTNFNGKSVSLPILANGIYIVSVAKGNAITTQKIMIK